MNKKQLSDHIGNMDDRLVEYAADIPNYRRQHTRKGIARIAAVAATFVLMACSFCIGTFAFTREKVVEIPVEQETVTLEEIGLTLILPDSWKGKYSMEKNGQNYIFYQTQIREAVSQTDESDGGILFYIVCYEEAMTPEQFVENGYDFVEYRYLFSTSDKTYILCYASDVQWNPDDAAQETAYSQMASEIRDIRFVAEHVFMD